MSCQVPDVLKEGCMSNIRQNQFDSQLVLFTISKIPTSMLENCFLFVFSKTVTQFEEDPLLSREIPFRRYDLPC
jgi:hypothetical protein